MSKKKRSDIILKKDIVKKGVEAAAKKAEEARSAHRRQPKRQRTPFPKLRMPPKRTAIR